MSEPVTTALDRLQRRAAEHQQHVNQVAELLWESIDINGDWEGRPPSWKEITDRRDEGDLGHYYSATMRNAEYLLSLTAEPAIALAKLLLDHALRFQQQVDLDLWRKIERAANYEPGSLTNKPGVKQRVFL